MSRRVTSIDVANLANVSQSTVSRVFSDDSPNVAQKTRERVLQAAHELGYRPNVIARMMSRSQTDIIGIVMANMTSPFYPYILDKFLQRFQTLGKQVLLFSVAEGHLVDEVLPQVLQYQVDALIITSAVLSSRMADECARTGTPVILFNRTVASNHINSVSADNVAGGRLVADYLLDNGHQQLVYMAGRADTSTNHERETGFEQRLAERGVTDWRRVQSDYTYQAGFDATVELLSEGYRPDAIFCANDIMAIGAIDGIRSMGLRIPDDISVMGFDNIPMARWGAYRLTTVSQEVDTMIEKTVMIFQQKMSDPQSPPIIEAVAGQLIMRESVRSMT